MIGRVWTHLWTCLDVFGRAWTCLDVFGRVWTCWNPVGRVWTWLSVIAGMIYCMASDREKPCRLASSTRHITKKHRKTPGRSRIYSDQKTHIYCVLNIIDPQNNIVLFLLSIESRFKSVCFCCFTLKHITTKGKSVCQRVIGISISFLLNKSVETYRVGSPTWASLLTDPS